MDRNNRGSRRDRTAKRGRDEVQTCVPVMGEMLSRWMVSIEEANELPVSAFTAVRAPSISLYDYLCRIATYCLCSPACFELALIYVQRILQSQPTFKVSPLNVHRLVITSVLVAVKYLDDKYYSNRFYALVGGIPLAEMNSLELAFLKLINFDLFVAEEEFSYIVRAFRMPAVPAVQEVSSVAPVSSNAYHEFHATDFLARRSSLDVVSDVPLGGPTAAFG